MATRPPTHCPGAGWVDYTPAARHIWHGLTTSRGTPTTASNRKDLANAAFPLEEPPTFSPLPLLNALSQWPEGEFALLMTTEDLTLPEGLQPSSIAIPMQSVPKSGGDELPVATAFKTGALADAAERAACAGFQVERISMLDATSVLAWCQQQHISTVAVAYVPVGPEADALGAIELTLADHDITLLRIRRRYDTLTWPHSTKGFFALKDKLPTCCKNSTCKTASTSCSHNARGTHHPPRRP